LEVEGQILVVAPPEYVIVRKLEYYRESGSEKHVRDIRSMLDTSPEAIQSAELEQQIAGGQGLTSFITLRTLATPMFAPTARVRL